jgi:hypothetical protein
MRGDAWVEETGENLSELKVRVRHSAVERRARMKDFRRWLESHGKNPSERAEATALGHRGQVLPVILTFVNA